MDLDSMTLRDFFAVFAMQGLMMGAYERTMNDWDAIPKDAYAMADAMLKEREEGRA